MGMQKILVSGPSWVGDMVMAQSLFRVLRRRYPYAVIDVLAPAWSQAILNRMPEINHVLDVPFQHGQFAFRKRIAFGKSLREQHYQQAIVLPNSWKSAIIPWAAKIPRRTGWVGEQRWGLLNDIRRLDKTKLPLMVQRFMALGLEKYAIFPKQLLSPQLVIDPAQLQAALTSLQIQLNAKPILAMCPGAEFGSSKRWPVAYFAQTACHALANEMAVWLFGSANDAPLAEEIMHQTDQQCLNLIGKTNLAQAVDLMSLAAVVLANDSGLMHIAAALDKPMLAVFGSSSPKFTPPMSDKAKLLALDLPCRPCFKRECPLKHHRCMQDIKPNQVIAELAQWIPVALP